MREAGDEPIANRIAILCHDNRNRYCCFLGGTGSYRTARDDDIHLETHEFRRKASQLVSLSLSVSILNHNIFSFYVPKLAQTLTESLGSGRASGRKGNV
jgi:hypothetical protein